jgi:hypothetical protein
MDDTPEAPDPPDPDDSSSGGSSSSNDGKGWHPSHPSPPIQNGVPSFGDGEALPPLGASPSPDLGLPALPSLGNPGPPAQQPVLGAPPTLTSPPVLGDQPPYGDSPPFGDLPPHAPAAAGRRRPTLGRVGLVAAGLVVLALVAGGLALGLDSGDDADADDLASGGGKPSSNSSDNNGSGSGESSGGAPEDPGTQTDDGQLEQAMQDYVDCMRAHGIDMPDPTMGDGGPTIGGLPSGDDSREDFAAADEACGSILGSAGPSLDLSPEQQAQALVQAQAMAACMRAKGYDFPDPEVDANGGITMDGGTLPGSGPTGQNLLQDMQECNAAAGMGNGTSDGDGTSGQPRVST